MMRIQDDVIMSRDPLNLDGCFEPTVNSPSFVAMALMFLKFQGGGNGMESAHLHPAPESQKKPV